MVSAIAGTAAASADSAIAGTAAASADDADEVNSQRSVQTTQNGDSVWGDDDLPDAEAVGEGLPTNPVAERKEATVRDTAPAGIMARGYHDLGAEAKDAFTQVYGGGENAANVGNFGWLLGNYGMLPQTKNAAVRDAIISQLRKGPQQLIMLCECEQPTEESLNAPGTPPPAEGCDSAPAIAGATLDHRAEYQYLTIRGHEKTSLLVGVRANVGSHLRFLYWTRRCDGLYKSPTKTDRSNKRAAYTRILIVSVTTDLGIAWLGKTHQVMVVHLHNMTAKKTFGQNLLDNHWQQMADLIKKYKVTVLAGDWNMALFNVRPALRNFGIKVSCAAWYPWKTLGGDLGVDSCAIFFVESIAVGDFKLLYPATRMHDRDDSGLFYMPAPITETSMNAAIAALQKGELDEWPWSYHRFCPIGFPGQLITAYEPKTRAGKYVPLQDRVSMLLTPLEESEAAIAAWTKALGEKKIGGHGQHSRGLQNSGATAAAGSAVEPPASPLEVRPQAGERIGRQAPLWEPLPPVLLHHT